MAIHFIGYTFSLIGSCVWAPDVMALTASSIQEFLG
jgi:hypothetical protein